MKKMLIIVAGVLLLVLAACSTGGSDETAGQASDGQSTNQSGIQTGEESGSLSEKSGSSTEKVRLSEDYSDALAVQAQLALGSLKLEDTELAIDKGLAAELLPLWQAHQSLSNSDTTAEAELMAVLNQIQDTMNPKQVTAITAMELTSDDITATIEEMGETLGPGAFRGGAGFGDGRDGNPGGFGGGPGGFGGGPGGGGPGGFGGGGPGGLGQLNDDDRATRIAERFGGEDIASVFTQRLLTNFLITTLQLKTGELDQDELRERAEQAGQRLDPVTAVGEATGLEAEALKEEMAGGATLAQAITTLGGDLEGAKAALVEAYGDLPVGEGQDVEQLVDNILNRSFAFSRDQEDE